MTMIKLVAFDLDGTVADTLADLAQAMNFALAEQNLPTYPVDDYRQLVGNGVDKLIQDAMAEAYTPEGAVQVKANFQRYYAEHSLDFTDAYPGMGELMKRLHDDGVATAVISNKPNQFVPGILKKLYPDHEFAYASGQQPEIPRKPDPTALERLLEFCGTDKGEALYVGDSNVDVVFAHNAGVKVCGVSWGFRGKKELEEAGADYLVDTADELYDIIRTL